jgi:hypothetical protein
MCGEWADSFELAVDRGDGGLDAGLARAAVETFRTLRCGAPNHALLCTVCTQGTS